MEITNCSHSQLVELGSLTNQDIKRIDQCRRNYNKIGFAYQVIFVKLANYFPKQKPFEIIPEVLTFAGLQLNIEESEIIFYKNRRETIAEHQEQIRCYLRLDRFNHKAVELLGVNFDMGNYCTLNIFSVYCTTDELSSNYGYFIKFRYGYFIKFR